MLLERFGRWSVIVGNSTSEATAFDHRPRSFLTISMYMRVSLSALTHNGERNGVP